MNGVGYITDTDIITAIDLRKLVGGCSLSFVEIPFATMWTNYGEDMWVYFNVWEKMYKYIVVVARVFFKGNTLTLVAVVYFLKSMSLGI